MADDEEIAEATENHSRGESLKRTQETQRLPAGIIGLPAGSRGPKSLYLKRISGSFGFTLRHFIIYPPDGLTEEDDQRLAVLGALNTPMETIFVRKVNYPGPAHSAGLQKGDRIVAVNGIQVIDKPYSYVIQLIQKSPAYLHLLVVPKEEDALQRLFTDTAYNPVSNRNFILDSPPPADRSQRNFLHQPEEFRVDAQCWKTLRHPFGAVYKNAEKRPRSFQLDQHRKLQQQQHRSSGPNEIYTEIEVHNASRQNGNSKAQPQVPLYRKMGRRASEGSTKQQQLHENFYDFPEYSSIVSDDETVLTNRKSASEKTSNSNMSIFSYPSSAGCRLSLNEHGNNNESSSSLNSSTCMDGSLSSNLTLTGHETDDSAILSRYRKSFQQKEEFLKMPTMNPYSTNSKPERNSKFSPEDCDNEKRSRSSSQLVQTRTKQFESGRPLPEDDPLLSDRTSFYKSELAKISSKRLVPNVSERAQEYETRNRTTVLQRECKSFEGCSGINNSSNEKKLSGNVLIPTGSKFIHCPTPMHVEEIQQRPTHRANSAEIDDRKLKEHNRAVEEEESVRPVVRRRIKNIPAGDDDRVTRRESYLKATEGSRLHFEYDLSENETPSKVTRSAHRRWRPPLFPGDIQQLRKLFEDAASSFGGSESSSTASLEKENPFERGRHDIIREGPLNCKITELDGKRPAVRSWRQTYAVLRGFKLFLYKSHQHFQSPMGTSDLFEPSLSNGIDIRSSLVQVAEDYTKRKHVLKVASNPSRSKLLLQAENGEELSEWMKMLKEQGAINGPDEITDLNKQPSVSPQMVPKSPTVDNHPLPQSTNLRNRSPTGGESTSCSQSPVKTRKTQYEIATTSPKSKTWRGRVAKQFRKIQGTNSPTMTVPPEGSTFGVPLDQCIMSSYNRYVPKFVEICTNIVDERGLHTVGIYRVPGNNASIIALSEEINRNYEDVPVDDVRWNDVHVVSSLLKSFFRKMPDSLVTNTFYLSFIRADKIDDPKERMKELKRLVKNLPPHNYHTLRHLILHLNRVMENSEINKMDAKNVAIVFGPNIVRPEEETMADMVSNNSHQCKILVTLLNHAHWFFSDTDEDVDLDAVKIQDAYVETETASNQQALLESISKLESLPHHKEKNGALFSSIISAAQRKVKRKTKGSLPDNNTKNDLPSPTNSLSFSPSHLKEEDSGSSSIPTTIRDIENNPTQKRVPWFNYATDQEEFQKRIEKFKNETKAMLMRPRYLEINVDKASRNSTSLTTATDKLSIMKTSSVSDVFNGSKSIDRISYQCDNNRRMQNEVSIERKTEVESPSKSYLKKIKYETSSLDSMNKCGTDDDTDLVSAMTKLYDKKLEDYTQLSNLDDDDIPYADESPERVRENYYSSNKENKMDLYKDPSLHKYRLFDKNQNNDKENEKNNEQEKDDDSSTESLPPDNERKLFKLTLRAATGSKLRRSESLNKPERNNKETVRRSESLSKTDKLTKNEKTECNIHKKRELLLTRRSKELKRKNGTPDRSIKRRHTVGGTKDPDKITLLDKYQESDDSKNGKEKDKVRTSSPDLSTTRRERFLFEINLIGPENMVVALKQHLIGGRPQSFPESRVFKVPLESHV